MNRWLAVLLPVTALLIAGCGGTDDDSESDRAIAAATVLTVRDLPGATPERRAAVLRQDADHGVPCGPLPILRRAGRPPVRSVTIAYRKADVSQAVGVFASSAQARRAFAELGSPRRRACILAALADLGGRYGSAPAVTPLPPIDLAYGDEAELLRFVINRPHPSVRKFVDTVAVRVGRAVSASVMLAATPRPIERLVGDATTVAAARMKSAQH